jgi:2-iminobutanoate/2-iminopropanoate deaminase
MPNLTKQVVLTDKYPPPMACLSQAVKVGDFVFVSGILPLDPATGKFVEGTVKERTVCVAENSLDVYDMELYG